jgi:hypothetical protein
MSGEGMDTFGGKRWFVWLLGYFFPPFFCCCELSKFVYINFVVTCLERCGMAVMVLDFEDRSRASTSSSPSAASSPSAPAFLLLLHHSHQLRALVLATLCSPITRVEYTTQTTSYPLMPSQRLTPGKPCDVQTRQSVRLHHSHAC